MGKSTSIYNPNIEKNPHIQRFRCMWGFQKGEDKYLTLSLVQSILLYRAGQVGALSLSDDNSINVFSFFIQKIKKFTIFLKAVLE